MCPTWVGFRPGKTLAGQQNDTAPFCNPRPGHRCGCGGHPVKCAIFLGVTILSLLLIAGLSNIAFAANSDSDLGNGGKYGGYGVSHF